MILKVNIKLFFKWDWVWGCGLVVHFYISHSNDTKIKKAALSAKLKPFYLAKDSDILF